MTARKLITKAEKTAKTKNRFILYETIITLAKKRQDIVINNQRMKDEEWTTISFPDQSKITVLFSEGSMTLPVEKLTETQREKVLTKIQAEADNDDKSFRFVRWDKNPDTPWTYQVLTQHITMSVSTPAKNLTSREREFFSKKFHDRSGVSYTSDWCSPWKKGMNLKGKNIEEMVENLYREHEEAIIEDYLMF